MKPSVKLKHWRVLLDADKNPLCLFGFPVGHPNPNGLVSGKKFIQTSQIVKLDKVNKFAETLNTMYHLIGDECTIEQQLELATALQG